MTNDNMQKFLGTGTRKLAAPKFEVHGEFMIATDGQMLISRLRGPFNVELTHAYFKAMTPFAQSLAQRGPWGSIAEFAESALFPLESADIMHERAIAGSAAGVVANCWVIPPAVEGYGVVEFKARQVYDGICPFEIFECHDDAHAWVLRQLQLSLS